MSLKHFDWDSIVNERAAAAGYQTVPPMMGRLFSRSGEVSPCLQIDLRRVTSKALAPEVVFGVYIEEFERDWRERLVRSGQPLATESPPLALFWANIASLRPRPWLPHLPSDEDVSAMQDWLSKAFEYGTRLPASADDLVNAIQRNRLVDHDLNAYFGHPVKVRGLVYWLRRTHDANLGARVLEMLSDRTGQYDVKTMLAPR